MPKIDYNELNGIALLLQQARLEILSDCESYEQNLHEFSSDTGLSGKSWSNAKKHAENVAPVVKALANALSQTGEVFSSYLSSFQSEVGSPKNRLDTDKLQELNDRLKQTRASKKAVLQQIEKLKNFPSNQIMGNSGSSYASSGFDNAIGTINKDIEILEKYRSFEAAHARDFAEVLQAFEAIQSGLKAISSGDTFSSDSGYQTKNMQKEAWMTTLATYNERQPKTHTEYVKRYQVVTDENGLTKTFVVYEVYTNGEYDYLKSQKVAELMQEAQMEKGKEFLLEITSVNDFIRTFKGVDPITGEKLSSQERGFAALMTFITVVSAGTAVKMLKNARRGATLMKDVDVAGEVSRIGDKSTANIISKYDDFYKYTFNGYNNPGPLAKMYGKPIKNFYGGRYNKRILTKDTYLYRGGEKGGLTIPGSERNALGQWFTSQPPESVIKVRIDTAVKPQWINPKTGIYEGKSIVNAVYKIKIPKGTVIYEGPVGLQDGLYAGGLEHTQIFISEPWKIRDIDVISESILK